MEAAGYSRKTLPAKLGFSDGMAAAFVALPESLTELAGSVAFRLVDCFSAWSGLRGRTARYDAVHAFSLSRAEIETEMATLEKAIVRNGMIWVSWPKKAAKIDTDASENVVRAAALRGDLVDVKIAAIDATWSGLKLVIRKDRR
jgi:hypothetical protein